MTINYDEILNAQRQFFRSGATLSYEFRMSQLENFKKMMINEADRFTQAVYKDLKRRPELTEFLEVSVTLLEIEQFQRNLKEWMKSEHVPKSPLMLSDHMYIYKEPVGVVFVISPYNYPIILSLTPIIPILAAGNTCILKPSELTPNVSALFHELAAKYFDPRVFTVILGDAPVTVALLKRRFDYICYTGSTRVGQIVLEAASKHLTPTVLELGGQSPVLVDDTVDLETAARRIMWAKMSNAGQTCLAPNHLLVTEKVKNKLLPIMRRILVEFFGADAQKSEDFMRFVCTRHYDRVLGLITATKGEVHAKLGVCDREDLFVPPMLVEVEEDDALLSEELFAPILPILTVDSEEQALDWISRGEKPLGAYIFSNDKKLVDKFLKRVQTGNVGINDVMLNFAIDTLPFGGVGNSGMGRYRGKYGFETFSNLKSVVHRSFWPDLLSCRFPPLTRQKYGIIQKSGVRIDSPQWLLPVIRATCLFGLGLAFGWGYANYSHQLSDILRSWLPNL